MSKRAVLVILGLAGFVVMADNWVVSPILPAISANLHVDPVRAGLVITAYMIPFGIFQLVFGPLADRYGKRQVISLAILIFTIGTSLCAAGFTLTQLAFYRALTGAFAASVMPISLALIGDIFPLAERQSAIGTFMGISFLGQGLSMAIGGSIAYLFSWRGVFGAYGLLALISTVLLFTAGKQMPSIKHPQSRILEPYGRLLGETASLYTYLVILFEGIFIVGSFSYLGTYISAAYHYNFLLIGLIMTAFGVAAVVGGLVSGKVAAALGRKPVFLAGLLAAAFADLTIHAAGWRLAGLLAGVTFLGLGFMLAHSTFLTITTEFAVKARGTAMSLVAFCFMGGGGLGTALGGQLIKAAGFSSFFRGFGLALLVLAAVAWFAVQPAGEQRPEGRKPEQWLRKKEATQVRSGKRAYLRWGLPALLIVFMMLWLGGTFHRGIIQPGKVKAAETSAAGVPLYTVSTVAALQVVEAVGTVQPQFKTTVSARVVANIIALPVAAGQHVRKGDLLVRLDDRDLRARRQQAQEALRRAEATRDLAQSDYERDKALFEKAVIPKSEFDQTALRLKTSTADVAGLQQAQHDANVTLGYAVICSPYDGVIIDKLSDVGDLAAPGKPLLALYESGRLWLEAAVPEEQAGDLHIGNAYQVHLDSLDKLMEGRLVEIVPSADPSSRTITARVTIPRTESVFPGLFGRMLIPVGAQERVMIPQSAILRVGQLTMVDVDESGTLRRRSVQVGREIADQVEILSGLIPGEKVSLAPRKELLP